MKKSFSLVFAAGLLLAGLATAGFCGGKKIICVIDLEDKSGNHGGWENVGTGVAEMLVTALAETKKYTLIERSKLEAVMDEQKLGASGAVTAQTAAKIGRLLGAQYIITGSITEFGIKNSKIGVGGLEKVLPFGGGAKMSKTKARTVIDVRAIDATTAQIAAAAKGEGEKSSAEFSGDLSIAPDFDFGKEGFDETILGKAARKAVDEVAKELGKKFDEGGTGAVKIIKIAGNQIYINSGEADGEKVGTVYNIFRPGEDMVDPDTGESLGSELEKVGTAKVTKVSPKYSIAETKAGGLTKTDILKAK
ncbi:MAG TPA: CsgG/HfaB family protein [Elusimicrobiales bacterium]|nr:CsgG/HfaB family protein [Elusimicrobiales bacterium]